MHSGAGGAAGLNTVVLPERRPVASEADPELTHATGESEAGGTSEPAHWASQSSDTKTKLLFRTDMQFSLRIT
jgi:hypothetical protein